APLLALLEGPKGRPPIHLGRERARVRVGEELRGIEVKPAGRVELTVGAKPVNLPGGEAGHVAVEDTFRDLRQGDPLALDAIGRCVEEAHLDPRRALGKDGEVNATTVVGGAERVRSSGASATDHRLMSTSSRGRSAFDYKGADGRATGTRR